MNSLYKEPTTLFKGIYPVPLTGHKGEIDFRITTLAYNFVQHRAYFAISGATTEADDGSEGDFGDFTCYLYEEDTKVTPIKFYNITESDAQIIMDFLNNFLETTYSPTVEEKENYFIRPFFPKNGYYDTVFI